ncbi:MAG: substrate-binding domain-containing protein [Anaerolineae bacterium]
MKRRFILLSLLLLIPACSPQQLATVQATQGSVVREVILATTSSTQDSGLLDMLVPDFQDKTGYIVKVIAVGTGAALEMGKKGDADVLLVHAPAAEKELVESGDVTDRRLVMHNDFVIVGPGDDPAKVRGMVNATEALKMIADAQAIFVSRGDDSGTHKMELALWEGAGVTPEGSWYQSSGQTMGATLKIASEKGGYTLTDRATYLATQKDLALVILVEGDKVLYNVYHVMAVNPEKHAGVNYEGARAFADYITSSETQKMIGEFGLEKFGQPLFIPDAGKPES